MNLLNLKGWTITNLITNKDDYRVAATYDGGETNDSCPHCVPQLFGKVYRHGSRKQFIMDLPSHGKRVGIDLVRKRYRCTNCGGTFLQYLPDVDDRSQMTRRLVRYIEEQSIKRTFVNVADEVGVDDKTVRNLFGEYVKRLDKEVVFETPEYMGIDEVHLLKKPRGVFTNLTEGTMFAVLAERKKKVITAYLEGIPERERIKVVTMDMWRPYADSVREVLPAATIVVDRFHVVRMASQSLEVVRKAQKASLEDKFRRKLKRDRFLLLRRAKDLNDEQRETMKGWFAQFPKLAEAYRLKEAFYDLWEIPKRDAAEIAFDEWSRSITEIELQAAYRPLLTAMANWRKEVFAFWDNRFTNALTEGLNGIAKGIERSGRGYSFDAIRAKLLYTKHLQKEARRPKYNSNRMDRDIQEGEVRDEYPPTFGTDIAKMLESLEHEATKRE